MRLPTMQEVIGANLRALRVELDLRQEDLAAGVQDYGLDWRRSTVAAIEAGRRAVPFEELVLLSLAFAKPLRWWIDGGKDPGPSIALTPNAAGPTRGVVSLLRGADPSEQLPRGRARGRGLDLSDWDLAAADGFRAWREAWNEEFELAQRWLPDLDRRAYAPIKLASTRDAELKAARLLGIEPIEVAAMSFALWGKGLTDRRDEMLEDEDLPPRSVQAKRGWITRTLIAELADRRDEEDHDG